MWHSLVVGWAALCRLASAIRWLVAVAWEITEYAVLGTQLAFAASLQFAAFHGQLVYHGSNCDATLRP